MERRIIAVTPHARPRGGRCYNPRVSAASAVARGAAAGPRVAGPPRPRSRARSPAGSSSSRRAAARPPTSPTWSSTSTGAQGEAQARDAPPMIMKGKAFSPRVVVVPVGGTVEFPNEDPIFHNVVLGLGREPLRPRALQAAEERVAGPSSTRAWCGLLQHPSADERGRGGARQPVLHQGGAPTARSRSRTCPPGKLHAQGLARARAARRRGRGRRCPARGRGRRRRAALDASSYKRVPAQEQVRQGLLQRTRSTEATRHGTDPEDPALHQRRWWWRWWRPRSPSPPSRPTGWPTRTIDQGLAETRQVWETFQADRYNKLKLGIRVLGNDPSSRPWSRPSDQATDPRHAARSATRS